MTSTANGEGMSFKRMDVYRAARELVLRVTGARIGDAELRDQATRAAKSVLLNLAEGLPLRQGARERHLLCARASVHEVAAAADVAAAMRVLDDDDAIAIEHLCDRVSAMLWRLTH